MRSELSVHFWGVWCRKLDRKEVAGAGGYVTVVASSTRTMWEEQRMRSELSVGFGGIL